MNDASRYRMDCSADPATLAAAARYYDLRHGRYALDVPLYRHLAAEAGGLVLELGCGTGRLLPVLAEAAPAVVGVEISRAMLHLAGQRLQRASGGNRVLLVQGDLRQWHASGARLAIMALNTFCHFHTVDEQLAVLGAAGSSLSPRGLLVIDVPNPHSQFGAGAPGACMLEGVHDAGEAVIYEWSVTEENLSEQVLTVHSFFDTFERGTARREQLTHGLRLFYRYELEHLLRMAGFGEWDIFGDYDCSPYGAQSARLLAIARKT